MLLVGDIGGTKTTVALYSLPLEVGSPILEMTYKSSEFNSLGDLVTTFFKSGGMDVTAAVFGAAGPVIDGSVRITNLPWNLVENDLEEELGIANVWLINDLESIASSIPFLSADDLSDIHHGEPVKGGTIAVIAPGTGLGEAFLTWDGGFYHPHASEGGHTDFGPTSKLETELLAFMLESYEHVSYERLCSGIGIPNIYSFLLSKPEYSEPEWLKGKRTSADDPTPVIVEAAGNEDSPVPICDETIRMFTSILGAECGNLALKFKATGGVYLGGGMIPKLLELMDLDAFRDAYINKGRFRDFVSKIPIYLIVHPEPAIVGAAYYAEKRLKNSD
jgi:glucokinase